MVFSAFSLGPLLRRKGQGRARQGGQSQGLEVSGVYFPILRRSCSGTGATVFMAVVAGMGIGSLCAVEVEGLKRRPPTEMGGLSLEFRVLGLGFWVQQLRIEQSLVNLPVS